MSAQHTPGPWRVTRDAYIIPAAHAGRPIGAHVDPETDRATYAHVICTMAQRFGIDAANARLIAAAPELLTELQGALMALEAYGFTQQAGTARAAIAKATGETR
jgi:hypothetical protein